MPLDVEVLVVHNEFEAVAARLRINAEQVVEDTAARVAASMRARAPGGRLPSTIRVRRRSALRRDVTAGDRKRFHAGFVEFGTIDQAAQPFAVPAAEEHRREFHRRMRTIVKVARRGG